MLKSTRRLKKVAALILIILLTLVLVYALSPFQGAIFGSLILFTLFRPLQKYFVSGLKINKNLSAFLVILITFVAILIPLIFTVTIIGKGVASYYTENKGRLNDLPSLLPDFVNEDKEIFEDVTIGSLIAEVDFSGTIKESAATIRDFAVSAAGSISNMSLQLVIMYFILFYLLKDMKKLTKIYYDYSPFNHRNSKRLLKEFHNMTYSNVVGAGINAVAQGIVLGLGFWLFGFSDPVFWAFVGGVLSFIPVIGPILVWLPASAFAILDGDYFAGIGILLWGVLVVSLVDNVIRLVVNSKMGHIHPLITLLGVFIGIPLFGVLGLVLGPALLSFFLLFVRMYREEFIASPKENFTSRQRLEQIKVNKQNTQPNINVNTKSPPK